MTENDSVNDYFRRFDCRLTAVKLVNPSELKLRDIRGSDFSQGAVPAPVERARISQPLVRLASGSENLLGAYPNVERGYFFPGLHQLWSCRFFT